MIGIQYASVLAGTFFFAVSGILATGDKARNWFVAAFTGFEKKNYYAKDTRRSKGYAEGIAKIPREPSVHLAPCLPTGKYPPRY